MSYKLGSLFDGSGGFPLSGALCDIEPCWAAEVEPYPIAVTRTRFPNMKHLGDISKINGAEIEPVDIITFGSPCQDLSVAGKRAGLKHEANGDEETTRSGLFMEAVRIIKEMREATNGQYPRFALWENVPGAFSSNNGNDFRVVCEELIKIVEPAAFMPPVPKNGWAYADSYVGDGWSLAYRTFDAQYWGVPQRRRRIHLVADFRGERAGEVLFEREGVRGYFETSRTPWQAAPGNAEDRTGAADREGDGDGKTTNTLTGDHNNRITDYSSVVVEPQPVICLQGNGIDRADTAGCNGAGWREDVSYTLNTIDRPAVAFQTYQKVTGPLMANSHPGSYTGQDAFSDMLVAGVDCRNMNESPELYPTLQAKPNGGQSLNFSHAVRIQYIVRRLTPTECARLQGFADHWGHIGKKDSLTPEEFRFWKDVRNTHAAINGKKVQDYTAAQMLTWYNKLHTDSAEYKMWGNGIALPPALYCMQGIVDALNAEEDDSWLM